MTRDFITLKSIFMSMYPKTVIPSKRKKNTNQKKKNKPK